VLSAIPEDDHIAGGADIDLYVCATKPSDVDSPMPRLRYFCGQNYLHYVTANTYRKGRVFDSDRYKRKFVQTLDNL